MEQDASSSYDLKIQNHHAKLNKNMIHLAHGQGSRLSVEAARMKNIDTLLHIAKSEKGGRKRSNFIHNYKKTFESVERGVR